MEQFNLSFIRCVLAERGSLLDVEIVMQSIFRDLGFREMISPVKRNYEFYPKEEYFNIRREEESLFAKLGSARLSEHDSDMTLKLIAEDWTIPSEMKWECAEDDDGANQQEDTEEEECNIKRPLLTCLRFRGDSAKTALSPVPASGYSWMGYVFGFNGIDRIVHALQRWSLCYPLEFHEIDDEEGDNVLGIRTNLILREEVSGYERFLQLALHELCFRLHAELAAQETTVVTAKPDETTGEGKWVDLFGFEPGVPRLLWQARPDMVFVKHPNAALEAELEAHQRLVCLLAANNGCLPKF